MKMSFAAVVAATLFATTAAQATLYGPSVYLSASDSPFAAATFDYFHLEDFEDHLFNVPGVSASAGYVTSTGFSGSIIDSVDGDDGNPNNGSCLGKTAAADGCDSYFASGNPGIRFTFDANILGSLPTHAGIVWTDGSGTISFEAFDANGISLGMLTGAHADSSFFGTTGDDRFYGASDANGISAIRIMNTSGGIEVDHLQYGGERPTTGGGGGNGTVGSPTVLALMLAGLAGLQLRRGRTA